MNYSVRRLLGALVIGMLTCPVDAQLQGLDNDVKVSARYHIESNTDKGFLIIKVDVPDGNYVYSLTQGKPLRPSKIEIKKSTQFKIAKQFKSDKKPKVVENDPVFNAKLEKFTGTVQFYVPITMADKTDPKTVTPVVKFSGQVCSEQGYCSPIDGIEAKAKFGGYYQREAKNNVPPLKQKK